MNYKGNLVGERILLRALERSDLGEQYLSWLRDPEVVQYLYTGIFPVRREDLDSYYEAMTRDQQNVLFAIELKEERRHIGNVRLGPIQWVHRRADFGILIGEKAFWQEGLGTEATRMAVGYAFEGLNLNKVTLGVVAEHKAAMRAYEKVGFEVEGHLRQDLYLNGRYCDTILMGCLRERFEQARREQVRTARQALP